VGEAVVSLLGAKGAQAQIAICKAMRLYFGYIDPAVVKGVLAGMVSEGRIDEREGPRGAKVFGLPALD
jgi:hypothetical protein